jgi:hypothetical protein
MDNQLISHSCAISIAAHEYNLHSSKASLKLARFISTTKNKSPYAAVAAKVSIRLPLVMILKTIENPAVNAAIIPSLAGMLFTRYNITMLKIGSSAESNVATIDVNWMNAFSSKVRISLREVVKIFSSPIRYNFGN